MKDKKQKQNKEAMKRKKVEGMKEQRKREK